MKLDFRTRVTHMFFTNQQGWHTSLLVTIFLLFAIGIPAFAGNSTPFEFPNQSDTILVGVEPDYPPYCSLDVNENPTGFAVDVLKAAAQKVGIELKFKTDNWMAIRQKLLDKEVDVLPIVGRTPERENLFDFSMSYLSLRGAVFVRQDDKSIQSLSDLKNKKILVMNADNSHEFVLRENLSPFIYTTASFDEAFGKLASGEGDAVITQYIIGLEIIKRLNLQRKIKPSKIELKNFNQEFCFAVANGNTQLINRLNDGLSIAISDGTLVRISEKWLGQKSEEKLSARDFVQVSLIIVMPLLLLMIFLWIVFLRREVKRRTERMYQEIAEHQHTLVNLKHQQALVNESEQQIRMLLNSTAEGIYGIDLNGNCTFINKSGIEILGYQNSEQLISRNMHQLIHHSKPNGAPIKNSNCLVHFSVMKGTGVINVNEFLWRADNSFFLAEFSSFPIFNEGIVTGAVVTFRDITERKKSEDELLQLKNELELKVKERTAELEEKVQKLARSQKAMLYMVEDLNRVTSELKEERRKLEISNKDLDSFTYSVSHDLRAPLRAINGFAGFLIEDYYSKLDDEGKRYIKIIRENATRMDHLINDMLMLSRISRTERKSEPVDFNEVVAKVITDGLTEYNNLNFVTSVAQLPVVKCDPGLIKQVWTNLINNAFKYSSKSEIRKIEIGIEENIHETIFYVKDSGAGFDPKYAHKLFGVFQRLHTDAEFEGTGVGLAIVKQIVQLHGGRVFADGEPGNGATFYFTLPKEKSSKK